MPHTLALATLNHKAARRNPAPTSSRSRQSTGGGEALCPPAEQAKQDKNHCESELNCAATVIILESRRSRVAAPTPGTGRRAGRGACPSDHSHQASTARARKRHIDANARNSVRAVPSHRALPRAPGGVFTISGAIGNQCCTRRTAKGQPGSKRHRMAGHSTMPTN